MQVCLESRGQLNSDEKVHDGALPRKQVDLEGVVERELEVALGLTGEEGVHCSPREREHICEKRKAEVSTWGSGEDPL